MKYLTEKQKKILDFIKEHIKKKGYPPTIKEIMENFSFSSPTSVVSYLKALEKKGFIKKFEKISRGIVLKEEVLNIPVLGRIPAGIPNIQEENLDGYIMADRQIIGEGEFFSLVVKGDSMKDAGILEGDYVIVKKDMEIKNGDIVVIFYDGQYTVKYFYKRKNYIELKPANPFYKPVIIKENPVILGKVIAIYRKIK